MGKNIQNYDKANSKVAEKEIEEKGEMQCFVIMPIGDHPTHEKGHFSKIYRDLIKPAIENAGFKAYRADEGGGSQNIQIDVIKQIIEAPMALCDLSTRNPNVLFELGIRQAFDLPVALIQEVGTERIFDINTFNTEEYRSGRIYDEVMEDRQIISNLIKTTFKKHNDGDGVNSIIRLIPSLEKAKLSDKEINSNGMINIMFNQMNKISDEIQGLKRRLDSNNDKYVETIIGKDSLLDDLLGDISPRDEKIYRLMKGYGVPKLTVDQISKIMGCNAVSILNSYYQTLHYLKENETNVCFNVKK